MPIHRTSCFASYNDARGGLYGPFVKPPFSFQGTQLQIFPLRAKLNRLQTFIDGYLNLAPQEAGEFRVFSPYVYLVSIYYGQLSLDAANLGWIAQDELLFGIPLLWYKRVGGRLVFHNYACVTPFIYVDSDHSMTTGRETFGWPKAQIIAEPLNEAWIKDPNASSLLMRFNIMAYSELYAGQRLMSEPLLELVNRRAESSLLRSPADSRASWLPWIAVPNALVSAMDLARDSVDLLRGLGWLTPQPGAGVDTYARMAAQVLEMIRLRGPGLTFNTVNLKQFRDAERPELAAYQGLTVAPMQWQRVQRAGLLGEEQILRGDPSGGLAINLYQYPTAPILQSLGLEFTEVHTIGTRTVHTLRPVLPMWVEADLQYNLGQTIAWRAKDFTGQDGKATWHLLDGRTLPPRPTDTECRFNTALGAAETEIAGPFEFPDVTVRVMPLLADKTRLDGFLQEYLGQPLQAVSQDNPEGGKFTIEAWGRYVYLCAYSYQAVSSQTNDLGNWEERELIFYVPAVVKKHGKLWKIALVPAYAYANSSTAAVTGAEVNGIPVAKAILESPGDVWMNSEGPGNPTMRTLLTASTTVLPAFGQGQEAKVRPFLEVFTGYPIPSEAREQWRGVAEDWGVKVKSELLARTEFLGKPSSYDREQEALSWAFDVLAQERPVRMLTLKQFRDAQNPQTACYQSIVEIEQAMTRVHNISEIENGLYVRIFRHPSLPIVEKLGLLPMMDDTERSGVFAQVFEPLRPFWMRLSLRESLGKNLFVHAATWRRAAEQNVDADWQSWNEKHFRSLVVADKIRESAPRGLRDRISDVDNPISEQSHGVAGKRQHKPDFLASKFDPQCFIEHVLSNYLERWDDDCPWVREFDAMRKMRDDARYGLDGLDALQAELRIFVQYGDGLLDPSLVARRLAAWYYANYVRLAGKAQRDWANKVREDWRTTTSRLYAVRRNSRNLIIWQNSDDRAGPWDPDDEWDPQLPWSESKGSQRSLQGWAEVPPLTGSALADAFRMWADEYSDSLCMYAARRKVSKPPQVIRRQMIANPEERERLFPRPLCFDERWYIGVSTGLVYEDLTPNPMPQSGDDVDVAQLDRYKRFQRAVARADQAIARAEGRRNSAARSVEAPAPRRKALRRKPKPADPAKAAGSRRKAPRPKPKPTS